MSASTPDSGIAVRAPRQDNRRQQLLDVAARLFRERGYHVTSMRDIAHEVGMLSGSIYYHFPSKEELLLAVYEEGLRHIAEQVDAAVAAQNTPWERLEAGCAAHLEALLELSDYTQVMIRVLPPEGGKVAERLLELRDRYEARFRELIGALELPDSADRRYLRLLLMGGLNWSHVWYHPGGDPPAVIAHRMIDLLRRGLDRARA
ncbi:MAG TPA: TetR/AcrR family transcriptional regulator [Candidatus Binataceae bacterium]|nr:TetR/AcrR family transcriptional regulator [Candidatus Binataceae bacterium]